MSSEGLDFYDRVVDALLAAGIRPFVTFYHWDLPQVLEDRGGWPARETADAFCEYVAAVAGRLGDRVGHWITHNEPWVASWLGYGWGKHAPGRTNEADAVAAAHHLLLSHGRAVEILRSASPKAEVGITLDLHPVYPASADEADASAAYHVDGFHNRWFLDPIFRGSYPEDILEYFGVNGPPVVEGDLEAIRAPIDFLGVNNYSRRLVRADPAGGYPMDVREPESQYTDMDWEVYPEGLHDLLLRLRDDYGPRSLYITENGASFADVRGARRPRARRRAPLLPREPHRGGRPRGPGGSARQRLLRVDAARQLRVGLGVLEEVRARLRRLPDARADPEGELLLVPGLHFEAEEDGPGREARPRLTAM